LRIGIEIEGGLSGLLGNGSFSGQAAANAANPIASFAAQSVDPTGADLTVYLELA
jgi:hypothetical protein